MTSQIIEPLRKCEAFILDMDGVLYKGDTPIKGAKETLEKLRESCREVKYLTNFPFSRETIQRKMRDVVKFEVPKEDIMTVAYATVMFMQKNGKEGDTCYTLAIDDLNEELKGSGMVLLDTKDIMDGNRLKQAPEWVVVSLYEGSDYYRRLNAAGHILRSGQLGKDRYLATSKGYGWTREDGITPGVGCTISVLETFSKKKPTVIGKPNTILTDMAFEKWGIGSEKRKTCVMVGDKWSDIDTAGECQLIPVKVESGEQDKFQGMECIGGRVKPRLVLERLDGIYGESKVLYCGEHG